MADNNSFLVDWADWTSRVFTYENIPLEPLEMLIIQKQDDNLFVTEKDYSTFNLGILNKEEILKLLNSGLLKYSPFDSVTRNYKIARTGGCDCGAWATKNPNMHAFHCTRYVKY